jgi:membrane-associated phospholipid phosphatase
MKRTFLIAFSAALVLSGAASAGSLLLTPDQYPPAQLLPPPPADGSPEAKAEMDELHHLQDTRTAKQFAAAMWDYKDEDITAFVGVIGPKFDLAKLPKTAALFAEVKAEEKAAGKLAKDYFQRNRPWVIDPSLKSCAKSDAPKSSYPSGHATLAYSMTFILSALVPEKSEALSARAKQYSENRLVCGMHYRRDIVAGQILGTDVAIDLMRNATFQQEFDAAKAELIAAKITK